MGTVFDKQELLDELDGDHEFLAESLAMFEADAPELLAKIRTAWEQGDAEGVHMGAHTLKSMVGNFCAQPAFDAALLIEQCGRGGELTGRQEKLTQLDTEVTELQQALRNLLKEIS